jgi:hypothetical protein
MNLGREKKLIVIEPAFVPLPETIDPEPRKVGFEPDPEMEPVPA